MRAENASATDLFSRLTSLITIADVEKPSELEEKLSGRIENLCTEILAWCIIRSDEFRRGFLGLFGFNSSVPIDVHTQVSLPTVGKDVAWNRMACGVCDLVIESRDEPKVALFVEIKAWSAFRPLQLRDYREAAARHPKYGKYKRRVVTITPYGDEPESSEHHVTWSQIVAELKQCAAACEGTSVLSQFATFLQSHGMDKPVAVDAFDSKVIGRWAEISKRIDQFSRLFESSMVLRKIFGRELDKPKVDYDDDGRSWLGVYTRGSLPWYYAGIGLIPEDEAIMWIEVVVQGDRRACRRSLPASLKESFGNVERYKRPNDTWSNLGKMDSDGNTSFAFAQAIDAEYDAQPQKMLGWINETIIAAKQFVEKHCPDIARQK